MRGSPLSFDLIEALAAGFDFFEVLYRYFGIQFAQGVVGRGGVARRTGQCRL